MGAADNFVAEGKAYATAARRKEEAGDKEAARGLYLQAAESYLNASKASSDKDEKEFRANMAQTFFGKSVSMRPQSSRPPGGGARLEGLVGLAERVLSLPVRLALPKGLAKMGEVLPDPAFATVVGLIMYGNRVRLLRDAREENWFGKLRSVFRGKAS
jgi:cell division ATPase FtsA